MSGLPDATSALPWAALTGVTAGHDPAPLSVHQICALGASAGRELGWGLRAVSSELAGWRMHALSIPDSTIRHDALQALSDGRALVDGAALFWILPSRRHPELLRLLVALQTLLNFLDLALERGARERGDPGRWMSLALDALDLDRPLPGIDGDLPLVDDAGYLRALTLACRAGCATLPQYRQAHGLLVREARRSRAFEIEHELDPRRRVAAMQQFAAHEFSATTDATWWEVTGGASSLLPAMAVLALAADDETIADDLRHAASAYMWVANAGALLDSYGDQLDDAVTGAHNWLAYYPAKNLALQRTAAVIDRALREAAALRNGDRHLVIVTSMVALMLSGDNARSRSLRSSTHALAAAGGSLTRLLIPILRAWRIAYRHRDG
ncbi:MAG TPA: DUF2600 family protein [Baekduia sp.]|nr:DUF2600 family protein [Baekduia sp.]